MSDPTPDEFRLAALSDIVSDWAQPPAETIAQLPKPYRKNSPKDNCGECGGYHGLPAVHLDYMGHADVTLALLEIDPEWRLEMGWDTTAGPVDPFAMGPAQMLARLTVLGVTRECVGSIPDGKVGTESALKELYGDALRNGAMRFGIGTNLWSKAQRAGHDPDSGAATGAESFDDAAAPPAPKPDPWSMNVTKGHMLVKLVTPHWEHVVAASPDLSAELDPREMAVELWGLTVGEVDSDTTFDRAAVDKLEADFRTLLDSRWPIPPAEQSTPGVDPPFENGGDGALDDDGDGPASTDQLAAASEWLAEATNRGMDES